VAERARVPALRFGPPRNGKRSATAAKTEMRTGRILRGPRADKTGNEPMPQASNSALNIQRIPHTAAHG